MGQPDLIEPDAVTLPVRNSLWHKVHEVLARQQSPGERTVDTTFMPGASNQVTCQNAYLRVAIVKDPKMSVSSSIRNWCLMAGCDPVVVWIKDVQGHCHLRVQS